ncbi:MAG: 2-C-methyl-D-erythritol 4-phosphate cytidylyltransferase [Gammaproteobacteria bacterium]
MQPEPRFWAVIPAAGVGMRMRMGGAIPKQYLALAGRTLIEHVLDIFLLHPRVSPASPWRWRRMIPAGSAACRVPGTNRCALPQAVRSAPTRC